MARPIPVENEVSKVAERDMMRRVSTHHDVPEPPVAAVRARAPGWRDPRLWVGVVIVAVSVIAGARLMAVADDSVSVWAVADDMGAGDRVRADDLVVQRVRFADDAQLERYFAADDPLPADLLLTRGVGAGELLPRAAAGTADDAGTLELPIAVNTGQVPPSVAAGSVVDVYLTGRRTSGEPVLVEATVIDAPPLDEGLAVSGQRQLVLGVSEDDAVTYFEVVGRIDTPSLTVVRRS